MRNVRGWILAAAALAALVSCGAPAPGQPRKLVVIAVDGLEPDVTERLMRAGRLPNLSALATERRVVRVTPTPGAEAASTWASFATGVNPGQHGIFDFVVPDPADGHVRASTLIPRPSSKWLGAWWTEGPAYAAVRKGTPFWTRLGEAGVRARVLFVPGTFPPEPVRHGEVIAGSPLPDLHGGLGGYTWLATDVPADRTGLTRFGGQVIRLSFERNVAHATLRGLGTPVVQDLPITVAWNPEARSANIDIAGTFVHLGEGQRSRWLEVSLSLNAFTRIDGLVQLHLFAAGNDVRLYVSPVQWHPNRPPSPIAEPPAAAASLFDRLGIYRANAWPGAGWALLDGHLGEADLLASIDETVNDRAAAIMNTVDSGGWDLVVAGIESLDVAQHLLWRLLDPGHAMYDIPLAGQYGRSIERLYVRVDELVGQVQEAMPDEASIVVVSGYGTYSARHVVDLNRWLHDEGLLAWSGEPPPVSLAALTDPAVGADHIDWSATRARAVGSGHIYVSLEGRDPRGTVAPGDEYEALVSRIETGLASLTDPISGRRVVSRVRRGGDLYTGALAAQAPDLVVSFSPGYTISWDTLLGGAAASVIARNQELWSAEHASADERTVPGVWLSSFPLTDTAISVLDVAPTIQRFFGQAPAAEIEGTSRLAAPALSPQPPPTDAESPSRR